MIPTLAFFADSLISIFSTCSFIVGMSADQSMTWPTFDNNRPGTLHVLNTQIKHPHNSWCFST